MHSVGYRVHVLGHGVYGHGHLSDAPRKLRHVHIVAMVTNVTIGANIELIKRISRMYDIFIHQSCWKTMVFRTRIEAVRWIKREVREKFGIDDLTFG